MPVLLSKVFKTKKSEVFPFIKGCRMYPSRPKAQKKCDNIAMRLAINKNMRKYTRKDGLTGYIISKMERKEALTFGAVREPTDDPAIANPTLLQQRFPVGSKKSATPITDLRNDLLAVAREFNETMRQMLIPIQGMSQKIYAVVDDINSWSMEERVRQGILPDPKQRRSSLSPPARSACRVCGETGHLTKNCPDASEKQKVREQERKKEKIKELAKEFEGA